MENKNYGEIFCQATEILAQHLIEQISFDRTILCTIVDDSEKNIGKYRVSNTDMTFDAYTSDTNYKINDNVYVSIPGGDWNEQKLIVSKKANDSETMVEYINPYDRFINITNNIIPTNNLTAGLVANDINKKQILLWSYNSNEDSTLKSGGEVYAGYTRLALSGSFQTLLKSFDVRFGDYGLNLVIKTAAADSDETAVKVCNLSCADMTGNPYNYQGFFPQAKIFDISNINQVIEMELWFYQKAGSFKNAQGATIPYENMSSNILVKDINVALGYDTQSFDKDTLILYTQDLTDYDVKEEDVKNHKKLEVRWIHKFDENGKIKVVELNDNIDYNLTFYRHSLGAPSYSVWSGVDWEFLSSQIVENGNVSYSSAEAARDPSYNVIWLKPDYNKAQERIKAILTYNDEVLFSSILTINNANEVVSQETVNVVSALNINCEDNSNGNYFLYRLDGKILDGAQSEIKRVFKLYFNTYGDTSGLLTEAESIEWIIPANNTMIKLWPDQGETLMDDGFYHVIKTGEEITNDEDPNRFNLFYTINRSHRWEYRNNTVKCIIVRNQITYTAIKELTFGTAGTAGTDYTFVLDFADNRYNALTIGKNETIEIEATLYDYTGKKLDISNRTIEWSLTTDGNDDNSHNDDGYIIINDTDFNKTKLQFNPDKSLTEVPDDNYTILKAKLTDWGDFDLEAYLPIPIRSSVEYQFISGATIIVYNSLGYLADTFKNPYVLYKQEGAESISGSWTIRSGADEENKKDPCSPTLTSEAILNPINIYVENTMTQLCVSGSVENKRVWSQPIYAYQNKYPTSIVNDWNGELTIDNNENAILAAKMVAGKKNSDNTFTGVMIGDWRGNDSVDVEGALSEHTGIYGFQEGIASFGFRDDGTAFMGKPGAGRLEFDGNKSTIQSNLMANGRGGMLLDFEDGLMKLVQSSNADNIVSISAGENITYPITVGKDKTFTVAWDGTVKAAGEITASSGKIGAWLIEKKDNEVEGETIIEDISTIGLLHTNKTYFFPDGRIRIGSLNNPKFEVQPDGTLISKGGSISITKGNKTIFEANNDGFNLANGKFVFNEASDTLTLKDITMSWTDGSSTDMENYLSNLRSDINNIENIGNKLVNGLGFTEIGDTYIISPAIAGGYLDIIGDNGSRVTIDPNLINNDEYIFQVNNGDQVSVGIDKDGNAEFAGAITSGSTITGAEITGGSILIGEDSDPIFKANEDGATFKGNITMTGGSISWASINESESSAYGLASSASSTANSAWSTASGAHALANAIKEGTCTGTFINGKAIYSPTIYAGKFYAVNGNAGTYATMEADGFKIFHGSTVNNEPKMKLVTENEGSNIVLKLGAGANDKDYENEGRLVFEKYSDHAEVYYMVNHTPYGFRFDSTGVTMLGGGAFDVGTQAYAVFG